MKSKKYFTKYLPVEGEIKFPTNIYCLEEGLRLNCQSMTCPDCRLAKLFLCSRDIQVGDKVQMTDSIHPIEIDGKINTIEMLAEGVWFKVIGEVSPDALSL